jgi:hypothetical protein
MLEKDIENLVADHPEDIFPGEGFRLIGQQQSIEERRIDILFQDKLDRNVIVEVKRGILSREASGQVAEYYGLLKSRNASQFYEMVLCANVIPKERRLFLEHIGIECKELGIAMISELAKKYDYTFMDDRPSFESPVTPPSEDQLQTGIDSNDAEVSVWLFQANPNRYDILNALSDAEIGNSIHWEVNQHKSKIRKGHLGLIWMSGTEAGIYALTRVESDPARMKEFSAERKYWSDTAEKEVALRVSMTVVRRLTTRPILKTFLMGLPGLQGLSILRQSRGTNFPVKNSEWRIIAQRM